MRPDVVRGGTTAPALPTGQGEEGRVHPVQEEAVGRLARGSSGVNWIGLWTLYRREVLRFSAVAAQAVPVTHEEPLFYTQSSTVWRRGKRNPENLVLERRR